MVEPLGANSLADHHNPPARRALIAVPAFRVALRSLVGWVSAAQPTGVRLVNRGPGGLRGLTHPTNATYREWKLPSAPRSKYPSSGTRQFLTLPCRSLRHAEPTSDHPLPARSHGPCSLIGHNS